MQYVLTTFFERLGQKVCYDVTYNIRSAFLPMGVLPADPFLYVWNATVMSLGIDNVIFF